MLQSCYPQGVLTASTGMMSQHNAPCKHNRTTWCKQAMKTVPDQKVMPLLQWQCALKAFTEDVTSASSKDECSACNLLWFTWHQRVIVPTCSHPKKGYSCKSDRMSVIASATATTMTSMAHHTAQHVDLPATIRGCAALLRLIVWYTASSSSTCSIATAKEKTVAPAYIRSLPMYTKL